MVALETRPVPPLLLGIPDRENEPSSGPGRRDPNENPIFSAGSAPQSQLKPGKHSIRDAVKDLTYSEMTLDKEQFTMTLSFSRIAGPRIASLRCGRTDLRPVSDDSPYAPYLRCWLDHRAAQHRDLLRNIAAAPRARFAPIIVRN